MTIEQKAKAYDEALERARELSKTTTGANYEYIFPELKEEDERIRKTLIEYFNEQCDMSDWNGIYGYQVVAWLEKLGNIDFVHYEDSENEKRKFVGYGFLKCKGDFLSFREGETYWLEYIGKDNYNVRSDNLLGQTFHIRPMELYTVFRPTTWLEKQGQQKPFDYENANIPQRDFAPKSAMEAIKEEKVDNANKLEPKFHEGEWIVDNQGLVHQIERVVENTTTHTFGYDIVGGGYFNDKSEGVHLWTIQDAKEGDVLVFKNNIGGIIICKSPTNYDTRSYCRIINGNFINKEESGWDSTLLVPATKEQHDLLFQKMKEAGYKWDEEKKELKKVWQKSEWSEEDEEELEIAIETLHKAGQHSSAIWLKSLKERIGG